VQLSVDDSPAVLSELGFPAEDHEPLRAARPELSPLLETAGSLVRSMGSLDLPPPFPSVPDPYFHAHVYLATLPHTRAYHQSRGIPAEVTRATLADLGRNYAVHRERTGTPGMFVPHWPMRHFSGTLYQLGRLQFERVRLGNRTGTAFRTAGLPHGPGDPVLLVHIPGRMGPLSEEECEASFAWAREFFPRHFPDETYAGFAIHSWLMDPQLAEYLPAESNIMRFQRRFREAYRPTDGDGDIVWFVAGLPLSQVDKMPQRTTLERAVRAHLRAGRHWTGGVGWMPW
jgi:hypothetical protein